MKGTPGKINGQEGAFLNFLRPLMSAGLQLMERVLTPLVLVPLGLIAAASATYAVIQKKIFGLGTTPLIVSNKEINDMTKIVKSIEESSLLIKGVSKTIKNKAKEQKGTFLNMLLGT